MHFIHARYTVFSFYIYTCKKKKNPRKRFTYYDVTYNSDVYVYITREYLREIVITVETYVMIKITNGRINMKNRLKLA